MPYEPNPDELGALWVKESSKGTFMTGSVNGVKVVVFKNDRKSSDRAPDWKIYRSKPRDGE